MWKRQGSQPRRNSLIFSEVPAVTADHNVKPGDYVAIRVLAVAPTPEEVLLQTVEKTQGAEALK